MAIKSRGSLQGFFTTGQRPKQQEFWDWLDSFYHKIEDPIKVGGWQVRSFLKDLRAEGTALTTGGFTMLEIPVSVTRLKRIRVFGKGTGFPFNITTSLVYFSDKLIPALNGVPSSGIPMGSGFFEYPIIGLGSNPAASFVISSPLGTFDALFDFSIIPKDVILDFIQVRNLQLTIKTSGTFTTGTDFVYCGLEYE
jgi:hypothetical protein